MPENRQKLNNASLQELQSRLIKEPALKQEILEKINTDGVASVVRELFTLSDSQNLNVGNLKSEMERHLAKLITSAIDSGGTIRLCPPDTNLILPVSSFSAGFHNGPGGTSFNVDVHC